MTAGFVSERCRFGIAGMNSLLPDPMHYPVL